MFIVLERGPATLFAAPTPGHVEAWGLNFNGEATVPPGLDGVIAVAGGSSHSLALRTNGTVVAWGANNSGQTNVPAGLSNVVAIAASNFSAALKSDGTVAVWGYNAAEVTNVPPTAVNVIQLALNQQAVYALRQDGTVIAWGFLHPSATNVVPTLSNIVQISAGNAHNLALKADGTIVGWGDNFHGQATPPPGLTNVILVRAGQETSLALKADGTMVKWGGAFDMHEIPPGVSNVIDFDLGFQHVLALRADGTVLAWGTDFAGQSSVPPLLNGVTAIGAGGNHNLVVTARPIINSITPPVSTTVGANVTLTVSASGEPLRYVWQHKGTNLPSAATASITIRNIQPSAAGSYAVYAVNAHGYNYAATSVSLPPPTISAQPQNRTVYRGENATFNVTPGGFEPFTFQWLRNGVPLANETNATLIVPTSNRDDSASFSVRVTDVAAGSVTSSNAALTVIDPRPGSARLRPVIDTSIHSGGSNPQGIATILSGTRQTLVTDRGLLLFDLSAIPTNATIDGALLRTRVVMAPRSPAPSTFRLHRLLKPWTIAATWANAAVSSSWSGPGGAAGIDYTTNAIPGEFLFGSGDYVFSSTNELFADLYTWIRNPSTNHGWILISDREGVAMTARHFGSSESTAPPELFVNFSFPAEAPTITNVRRDSTNFLFQFAGSPGWIYNIQTREFVNSGIWTALTNIPAGAALEPIVISIPMTNRHQFFRAFRY